MGLAWGLVPCGMVYGALTLALLAGNAASGALVMGVFGLGTLPNLLVLSGLSGYLRTLSRRPGVRLGAGLAVMAFGAGIASSGAAATFAGRAWILPGVLRRPRARARMMVAGGGENAIQSPTLRYRAV